MRIVILVFLFLGVGVVGRAQSDVSYDFRFSIGVNANSEFVRGDSELSELEYAGLGWHISNQFYWGGLNKWKVLAGVEKTKSVTDLDSRFELQRTAGAGSSTGLVDPQSVGSTFFKVGGGGQILLAYFPKTSTAIFTEGTINYNAIIQRDADVLLKDNVGIYDMKSHADFDLGVYVRCHKVSLGVIYSTNISRLSDQIDNLHKNVISLDLGYTL